MPEQPSFQVHSIPAAQNQAAQLSQQQAQQSQPSLQFLSYLYQQFHKKSGDQYLLEKLNQSNGNHGTQGNNSVESGPSEVQQAYERDLNQWFITRIKSILASELLNAAQNQVREQATGTTFVQTNQTNILNREKGGPPPVNTHPNFNSRANVPPNVVLTEQGRIASNAGNHPHGPFRAALTAQETTEQLNDLAARGTCVWGPQQSTTNGGVAYRRNPQKIAGGKQMGAPGFTPVKTEIATVDMSAGFEQACILPNNNKRLYYVNIGTAAGLSNPIPTGPIAAHYSAQQQMNLVAAQQSQAAATLANVQMNVNRTVANQSAHESSSTTYMVEQQQRHHQQLLPQQYQNIPVMSGPGAHLTHNMATTQSQQLQQQPPGSKGSQHRAQQNQQPLVSPKQSQNSHLLPQQQIRRPRELTHLLKGVGGSSSGGKTIISTKDRGRVLNLPPEQSNEGDNAQKQQQQNQWMRKQSNNGGHVPGHSGSAGQAQTINSTIDDLTAGTNQNLTGRPVPTVNTGSSQKHGNYNNYAADGIGASIFQSGSAANSNGMKPPNSVHINTKKPFSLAGALLNDYQRQTLMYVHNINVNNGESQITQNMLQPQSAVQQTKKISATNPSLSTSQHQHSFLTFNAEQRHSLGSHNGPQQQVPPAYEGVYSQQVQRASGTQQRGLMAFAQNQQHSEPPKGNTKLISSQEPGKQIIQSHSALQQNSQLQPRQESQRISGPAVTTNQYGQTGPPKPAVIHRTNHEVSQPRRTLTQFPENAPIEQASHPHTSHNQYAVIQNSNTQGLLSQQPLCNSAMGAAQNAPNSNTYRQTKKNPMIQSGQRSEQGIPQQRQPINQTTNTGSGGNQVPATLASGMHSLEKLKEYESKLLLQNSQTQLTAVVTNSGPQHKSGQVRKASEQQKRLPDSAARPLSNRQTRNLLEAKKEKGAEKP